MAPFITRFPISLLCIVFIIKNQQTLGSVPEVSTLLYGSAVLPCRFPFVTGTEGLFVTWEKVSDGEGNVLDLLVQSSMYGKDITANQDDQYKGRAKMSEYLPRGTLDLILSEVSVNDEGIYVCTAANAKDRDSLHIKLSVKDLNAEIASVTVVQTPNGERLKCLGTGHYRNPFVQWHDRDKTDLSSYGELTVSDLGGGKKMVESLLNVEFESKTHYFCHIVEGKWRRSVRAVKSGEAVELKDEL